LKFVVENPPGYGIRKDPYRAVVLSKFLTSFGMRSKVRM
jgi:hypothetical protein